MDGNIAFLRGGWCLLGGGKRGFKLGGIRVGYCGFRLPRYIYIYIYIIFVFLFKQNVNR